MTMETLLSSRVRDSSGRPPSQKLMLSKALQRANMAVQLDNAQNFEGARQSYAEACKLLQNVLNRTTGEDDKRKLEAIRVTYTNRINELDQLTPFHPNGEKALPARPESLSGRSQSFSPMGDDRNSADIDDRNRRFDDGIYPHESNHDLQPHTATAKDSQLGRLQTNPPTDCFPATSRSNETDVGSVWSQGGQDEPAPLQSSFSKANGSRRHATDVQCTTPGQLDAQPGHTIGSKAVSSVERAEIITFDAPLKSNFSFPTSRASLDSSSQTENNSMSHESSSWLDPIDESGGSTASSVHSRSSSMGIKRKHIRAASGTTEAEFDAALDAAVEAAYDEGFEPIQDEIEIGDIDSDDEVLSALHEARMVKEQSRIQASEMMSDPIHDNYESEVRQIQQPSDFFDDDSSDEEERMLEEMSRGYSIDDFTFAERSLKVDATERSLSPNGDGASNPSVGSSMSAMEKSSAVLIPTAQSNNESLDTSTDTISSHIRRLSGHNPKHLKIETSRVESSQQNISLDKNRLEDPSLNDAAQESLTDMYIETDAQSLSPTTHHSLSTTQRESSEIEFDLAVNNSPTVSRPGLTKNYSTSSLLSSRGRKSSISNLEEDLSLSPGTPSSTLFSIHGRYQGMPPLLMPTDFGERLTESSSDGVFLFDDNLCSPISPVSPTSQHPGGPVSLEPCPLESLLRPFWLMRCLYQTLAHPRGGYLSTKLFVPRDVWKVKGVRLRNVEDKIANCDFLTAALLKLGRVDTLDADAVLEEMQSLEIVIDQVQGNLLRKLGGDVGPQVAGTTPGAVETEPPVGVPRSASVSGKPSSFSWKRLRSKNPTPGNGTPAITRPAAPEFESEPIIPASLPMTTTPTSRPPKRDFNQVQFTGPNASYMSSLARLFDAAQTIDEIARQVEDPGLRHADKTQVGLELSTRHAAEFFGFYICRFVMADLAVLLDKFIKRGSEWVMS